MRIYYVTFVIKDEVSMRIESTTIPYKDNIVTTSDLFSLEKQVRRKINAKNTDELITLSWHELWQD